MARPLDLDELLEHFTLADDELELLRNKSGATRLGFGLLLKYLAWKGRLTRGRGELPDNAIDHVARQVGVPPEDLGLYDWTGRQSKRHRVEARQHLGFRECSVADADKLTAWLAEHVAQAERRPERVREELLANCHAERIEPPTAGRVDRMVASALHQAEQALSLRIAARLPAAAAARLEELVAVAADDAGADEGEGEEEAEGPALLALIKSDPGNVSLETMLTEIGKLEAVRAVGLPARLFADVAPRVVAGWRARATVEAPSHLRTHPEPLRLTLLAALLHTRERELTDTLVDLLIALEAHNRGQQIILYGKGGELATNRRDERELTVTCLRVLQAALVYVNTLMLQDILADPAWEQTLTVEDRRGLTPLFWSHVAPYGEVRLDMASRLSLRAAPSPGDQRSSR